MSGYIYRNGLQESEIPYTPDKVAHVRRTHKDKLFRYLFGNKKKLLNLYNAINGTSYEDENKLTVNTLENVIYLSYKNDLSFILDWAMNLYEHQSTWNPNIPARGFLYFARLYREYIEMNQISLYGKNLVELPFPQYVVFYNGTEDRPDKEILKLSDAFRKPDNLDTEKCVPALECTAIVYNINHGKNKELLEKCRPLMEYSKFVHYIRQNVDNGLNPQTAVTFAVDRCLNESILTDVLMEHRQEVVSMFLDEYDDELFTKWLHRDIARDARNEGLELGRNEGLELGRTEGIDFLSQVAVCLLRDNRQEELYKSFTDKELQKRLLEEYSAECGMKPETNESA